MLYQAIQFTRGRSGTGYIEISEDGVLPVAVLDEAGVPVIETVIEYHIIDPDPVAQAWMKLGV